MEVNEERQPEQPVSAEGAAAAAEASHEDIAGERVAQQPEAEAHPPARRDPQPAAAGQERPRAAERPPRPAAQATTGERPPRSTSDVPGRVPEPAAVAVAQPRPESVGVRLENLRLTPVEIEQPKALYRSVLPGILQVPADFIIAAARKSSLWPMTFGLACCAIEMIATYMSHHDLDRFGIVPWPSPRQCDVMIVAGTVTKKMAPAVKLLYQQMPNPKWVISMGACATNGGPYTRYDRVLQGVDKIIPVDVYVPGCPPRPEALIDGFIALQNKIMEERSRLG